MEISKLNWVEKMVERKVERKDRMKVVVSADLYSGENLVNKLVGRLVPN